MVRNGITSSYITRRPGDKTSGLFACLDLPFKVYAKCEIFFPSVINIATIFHLPVLPAVQLTSVFHIVQYKCYDIVATLSRRCYSISVSQLFLKS